MNAVLVDSSVLLDVVSDDDEWAERSEAAIIDAGRARELVINSIIFAEVSISFTRVEDVDMRLSRGIFRREEIPWEAAFLAGKAAVEYRRRGGSRPRPLPGFLIGAHAAVRGYDLLTRDPSGLCSYFPTVALLVPA